HGLDVPQALPGDLARLGLAGRDADAAIAHHHGGDAVPRRGRDRAVPANLRVVVGVRIDEARRHDQPVGIDGALGALADLADLGHLAAGNGDVGLVALGARAVDHGAVPDHEIVAHEFLPRPKLRRYP